ncbi:RNA-binding domain-containing protein [Burkholderia gladioli]|uniref:RNA-binding domain-containing protein n=1 Tax=Burkholderia gladioli TaxID=28095 RepID=UPI00164173A8|nr:RNA-binding domain-containing protein [Burkholderia gladioli]
MSQNAQSLLDLRVLAEAFDLECKAAQGRNGRGELPAAFWESYSALANTNGGVIYLGIEEKPAGAFRAIGLADFDKVRKSIWDNLHNQKQISINLLLESQVQPVLIEGKTVLRIEVPKASRQQKPVHVGVNPFGGTYLRRHEGDYLADDEAVRRMLAERVEDARDERILTGFDFADLDSESITAYRNRFSAVKPGHVWLDLPMPDFLQKIGAIGRNREEGTTGLRLAGLLMFGKAESIRDVLPNYMVDYQERPEAKAERRWVDRIAPDGTWSGNVYDFFRRVYQKLTADLKVPFQLTVGQRVEDTPVHEALREALANTLIHADFTGRVSVLVVKRPDMFGFRNPGLMRIPLDVALAGGNSDCRNRRLQTMFQLVGYGDHAGSGLPKIYVNWKGQHWRVPSLYEMAEPEQTLMELRMTSLVPLETLSNLEERFGARFASLPELDRVALVTASIEGTVNHARLREVSTEHPSDISRALSGLVREGLLASIGMGRGTVYFLPGTTPSSPNDVFSSVPDVPSRVAEVQSLEGSDLSLKGSESTELLTFRDPDTLPLPLREQLQGVAHRVTTKRRASQMDMWPVVHELCADRYLGLKVLAALLDRSEDYLRPRVLNPMLKQGALHLAYPSTPNHPEQAYRSNPNWSLLALLGLDGTPGKTKS